MTYAAMVFGLAVIASVIWLVISRRRSAARQLAMTNRNARIRQNWEQMVRQQKDAERLH